MSEFIYLCSPYSHPDARVRCERYWAALQEAADLMQEQGMAVFAPIAHSHSIAEHLPAELAYSKHFWMAQDLPLLRHAFKVIVLTLPGWEDSWGIAQEIREARLWHIAVGFRRPRNATRWGVGRDHRELSSTPENHPFGEAYLSISPEPAWPSPESPPSEPPNTPGKDGSQSQKE